MRSFILTLLVRLAHYVAEHPDQVVSAVQAVSDARKK